MTATPCSEASTRRSPHGEYTPSRPSHRRGSRDSRATTHVFDGSVSSQDDDDEGLQSPIYI